MTSTKVTKIHSNLPTVYELFISLIHVNNYLECQETFKVLIINIFAKVGVLLLRSRKHVQVRVNNRELCFELMLLIY